MARDWDRDEAEVANSAGISTQVASSMGMESQKASRQAPLEEALVSLDTSINKLDKVVINMLIRLQPISRMSPDTEMVSSPSEPSSNSSVVSTLQEYNRRITAIMTHVAVAIDELEV